MKKLLLFVLLAALFPFTRMQAEVTRATQLFGTWQFTADIELTDDGQAYSDIISNNCEVTITSHSLYDFTISGFAGATTDIRANFYTTTTPASIRFMNTSMSGYNPWGTGIDVSTDGETYPASNYRMYMDPDNDNVINVTDFYIVYAYYDSSIGDYGEYVVTPLAHVTNGTLTLIEKAYVEITDLSGDWHFTSTASMADSELPTEFDFNLESNSGSFDPYSVNDGSCAYFTATLSFEGYDPVLIEDAAFDGYQIEIPFNDTYLDEANNIAFYVYNSTSREGSITFKKNSDISLSLDAAFAIGQETTIEEADTLITLQYYTDGSAAKQVDSYDFSGTYHITVDNIIYSGVDEYTSYPETFDMVITYNSAVSKYYITSFLGNDTYSLNQGGIPAVATTTDDGNNILKIAVGNTRYVARIDDDGSYQYHVLYNGLGLATDSIQLTVSYDGTITMEDFTLYHINYGSSDAQLAAYFQNLTVTKEGEAEPYDFTGTYTATCLSTDLEVLNDDLGYGYPTEFEVVISDYNESTGKYYIYTFLNENTNSINYGGIPMVASDDNSDVQVVTTDKYIKTIEAGTYMKLRDVDGGSNTINLTANEDGTLTLDDFSVVIYDFDAGEYIAAIYHNVTLTKASDAVKSISAPAKNEAKVYAAAGTIYVIGGEPTYVEVYNAAGVQVYAGIASEVSGLARGIYYVRAGQTVTPVIL